MPASEVQAERVMNPSTRRLIFTVLGSVAGDAVLHVVLLVMAGLRVFEVVTADGRAAAARLAVRAGEPATKEERDIIDPWSEDKPARITSLGCTCNVTLGLSFRISANKN
jgi:hypothetical protein